MSSAEDLYNQGITEMNLGNPKKALLFFEQALQVEPRHAGALIKKGNIFGKFARYEEAVSCYDEVLETEPANALALVNKGLALHYLQRYDDAVSCFDKILEERPSSAMALYNKASSLAMQGRSKESLEFLEKSIRQDFSYKYKARADADFESIRKTNEFKKTVF